MLKTWPSTQPTVSLSSGEAEFYGVVKAAGLVLGQQAVLRDLGYELPVRVWTDSSAAMGICARQGLGKLRHIATHTLWVQEKVRSGAIELRKVRGEVNPADLFTKHLPSKDRVEMLVKLFGCDYRAGRAESAPKLRRKDEEEHVQVALNEEEADEETVAVETVAVKSEPVVSEDYPEYNNFPRHDPDILPHCYETAAWKTFFPIAVAPDAEDDNEEFDDWALEAPDPDLFVKHKGASRTRRS